MGVELEVCRRTGRLVEDCGGFSCENGCDVEMVEFVRAGEGSADLLRDLDALRAGLERLDDVELGRVLGVVLRGLDHRGDSPLPALLRVLADQVDELMTDMEQSARPDGSPS